MDPDQLTPDVHDAVQCYLDALLTSEDATTPPAPGSATPDASRAYRICHISSVQLALPATSLGDPIPLPPLLAYSAADWFLGRHHHDGMQLQVFDLARIVAPDVPRCQAETLIPVRSRQWAVACTLQPEVIRLTHEQVQWREPGGMRPWLSGMSRDGRCAIIDIPAMLDMLESDPRFHPAHPGDMQP